MVTIDQYWLAFVIAVALPAVTALITKQAASGQVKSLVLLALTIVTATAVQIANSGGTFDLAETAKTTLVAFVVAVCSHFGLLKPLGATGSEGVIQKSLPGGVG